MHPRASARAKRRRGIYGPTPTPWKYRLNTGKLIRRGWEYDVRLLKNDVVVWEGPVVG